MTNPHLPGNGTSTEKSFVYHKASVGHAADTSGMDNAVGYDDEQDYSYARCSMFMGAVMLQGDGVVEITADGSNYA